MSRKSTVTDLSEKDIKELTELLILGQLPQNKIAEKFSVSKSALSRYWFKYRNHSKRLDNIGISCAMSNKYKTDFEELAWQLLERDILSEKRQDNESKISELKAKIPFFNRGAKND